MGHTDLSSENGLQGSGLNPFSDTKRFQFAFANTGRQTLGAFSFAGVLFFECDYKINYFAIVNQNETAEF